MNERILVTGSSGMIGTRLCEMLLSRGYDVVGADSRDNAWSQEIDARTIKLDLRDREKVLRDLPHDVSAVIHLAANARVHNLVVDPTLARDNFETTFNTLEYARRAGIRKFMFASSREVYGNGNKFVHAEEDVVLRNCPSPYTASKMAGEAMVWSFSECYGMDAIVFRFSNVYGRYDLSDRFVPLVIRKCLKNEEIVIFGEEKTLDCTYLDDTVNGIMLALEGFEAAKNEVFNLAYGSGSRLIDVAEEVKRLTGSTSPIVIQGNRTGEVVKYVADIGKASKAFGYRPTTAINDGLALALEWSRAHDPEVAVADAYAAS